LRFAFVLISVSLLGFGAFIDTPPSSSSDGSANDAYSGKSVLGQSAFRHRLCPARRMVAQKFKES
jgi:hypothetical protein